MLLALPAAAHAGGPNPADELSWDCGYWGAGLPEFMTSFWRRHTG